MHRQLTDRHDGERGTTLAEVLVAGALAVLVAALAMTLFVAGQRSAAETAGRVETTEASRVAFDALTRLVRTAVPVPVPSADPVAFTVAEPDRVAFFANNSPGAAPTFVQLVVDPAARTLTQVSTPQQWHATSGTWVAHPTQPTTSRVLLRNLRITPQPVFRYIAAVSEPPSTVCTTAGGCALPTTPLTADERRRVRSVVVELSVSTPAVRTGSSVDLRSSVQVPSTAALKG